MVGPGALVYHRTLALVLCIVSVRAPPRFDVAIILLCDILNFTTSVCSGVGRTDEENWKMHMKANDK